MQYRTYLLCLFGDVSEEVQILSHCNPLKTMSREKTFVLREKGSLSLMYKKPQTNNN